MHPVDALPTGTVTFLFTDIEGSTRLAERLGAAARGEVLQGRPGVLAAACPAPSGREIKTEGDSFFVVFRSAQAAVGATVDAQRALAAHAWPDGAAVRVRMGLHTGEGVLVSDGDYVGLDVHRAARVAQVPAPPPPRALVDGALPAGVELRDLGEHRLKDLSRPERIGQLVIVGPPDHLPAPKTLSKLPNKLPVMLTTFVGRGSEVARVRELLAESRLLTLTGPGGTGKTRLSLQLAAEAIDAFPAGVFFVALGPISDHTLVAGTIASVLGIQDVGGAPIEQRLADYLAPRRLLLVLDNFEQVTDAAPLINDLLRSAPELKCLVPR